MRFRKLHQESEWQEQDEAKRVFSFGSLLLDVYGEQPPAIGRLLIELYCTYVTRYFDREPVIDYWFHLKFYLTRLLSFMLNCIRFQCRRITKVYNVKLYNFAPAASQCDYSALEFLRDFQALAAPCTPPSSNHLTCLPIHCHTNLFGPIWHMVSYGQHQLSQCFQWREILWGGGCVVD